MKKKVLRIINRFNLGGPTYNAAYLTKYLEDEYETLLVGGIHDDSEESSMHILNDLGLEPIVIPEMKRSINLKNDRIIILKAFVVVNSLVAKALTDTVNVCVPALPPIDATIGIKTAKATTFSIEAWKNAITIEAKTAVSQLIKSHENLDLVVSTTAL